MDPAYSGASPAQPLMVWPYGGDQANMPVVSSETAWVVHRLQALKEGYTPNYFPLNYQQVEASQNAYYNMAAPPSVADWGSPITIFDMVELVVTCPSFAALCTEQIGSRANALHAAGTKVDYQSLLAQQQLMHPYLRFNRRIGVHAGITLYNLHRVLCYCCEYDEQLAETPLHTWAIPNAQAVYANGHVFRQEARKSKGLLTDKTVSLNEFIPPDNWSGFQMEYTLGGIHFNVLVNDLLKGQTAQQDLLWVPRLCDGSFGLPPPPAIITHPHSAQLLAKYQFGAIGSSHSSRKRSRRSRATADLSYDSYDEDEVVLSQSESEARNRMDSGDEGLYSASDTLGRSHCTSSSSLYDSIVVKEAERWTVLDIDGVNRLLSETRFGRNLAVSRKSKRTRITAFKEEAARLMQFRLPIRVFFGEPLSKMEGCVEKPKRRKRASVSRCSTEGDGGESSLMRGSCSSEQNSVP